MHLKILENLSKILLVCVLLILFQIKLQLFHSLIFTVAKLRTLHPLGVGRIILKTVMFFWAHDVSWFSYCTMNERLNIEHHLS